MYIEGSKLLPHNLMKTLKTKGYRKLFLSRMGLQARIGLLVALPLVIVFIAFAYIGLRTLEQSRQLSLNERLLVTQVLAKKMDEELGRTLNSLGEIAKISEVRRGDWTSAKNALQNMAIYSGLKMDSVFILDVKSKTLWNYPTANLLSSAVLAGYPSIQKTFTNQTPQVSNLMFQSVAGEPRIFLTVPVISPQGEVIGIVGGAVNPTSGSLANLVAPLRLGRSGYAELVDENGIVLASARPERLFLKDDHADRFQNLIQKGESRVAACHRCHEGEDPQRLPDVLAFTPISLAPWGVAVRQLEEEAFAATDTMRNNMFLFGGPLVLVAVYISWIATRQVVRPIKELTVASKRIAQGDLDFAVASKSQDEIGTLALTFDAMRSQLKYSYQEIEEWNRSLEERVARRTKELTTVLDASKLVTLTVSLDNLLQTVVENLSRIVSPGDAGILYFYDDDEDILTVRSSYRFHSTDLANLKLRPGEGLAGKAFVTRQPILATSAEDMEEVKNAMSSANRDNWQKAISNMGTIYSAVAAPLFSRGKGIGCLELINLRPEEKFTNSDLPVVGAIADQIAVAIENARLYESLHEKEILRGQLLERAISVQEDERKRIARELHDEAGQSLTALKLSLAQLDDSLPVDNERARDMLQQSKGLAEGLLAEIRRLISDLRPTILDELGLIPALRRYAKQYSEMVPLEIQVKVGGSGKRLMPQLETALYRITQEALNNASKHARASAATVYLNFNGSKVTLMVEDNGLGFELQEVLKSKDHNRGLGLLGMQERAVLCGGVFHIDSQPGKGTRVTVEVPIA